MKMKLKLKRITFPVGPLACNCSIVFDPNSKEAIVIDPGDEAHEIINHLTKEKINVKWALHTHAHFDHFGASAELKEWDSKIKLSLHQSDHELWKNLVKQGSMFGFEFGEPRPVDHFLLDEEELKIGDSKFKILHTPGHSPGGVCIRFNEGELAEVPILFSGDTLFQSSIGRTDLWGGDYKTLVQSIKQRIFSLDEETTVVPGHGFETSIAEERRDNPFLK